MNQNLPISRLVNFGAVITPQGVQAPTLNTGLVLDTSTVIDVVSRMRTYDSLDAVAADFGTTSPVYYSAAAWFGQSPQPTSLNVGRWAQSASAGQLICAPLSPTNSLVATWAAIASGSFKVAVDGGSVTNTGSIVFTGVTTLPGVAALIQTQLRTLGGAFTAVTCTYDSVYNNFTITSGTTGTSSAVSFLTAGTTGTDVSGMMGGLSTDSGAYVANGIAAETALAAVTLFDDEFGGQWYANFGPEYADSDCEAIGPYFDADNTPHFLWYNSQESAMLGSGATGSIGYAMQQLQTQHCAIQYSGQSEYAAWSMAARIATVNWAGSLTAISLMYKQEPGIAPDNLNVSQINNLESYNVNGYVVYAGGSGTPILETGVTPSGQFVDTIYGVDGLRTQMMTNVFNILFSQTTKVPQTDAGANTILTGVTNACVQYITNGFGAPGIWNAAGFGSLVQGEYLDTGYYAYVAPIASQTEAERQERICPPISVAFKLAGAINTVSGTIFINQ